jgi:hypothetical protein
LLNLQLRNYVISIVIYRNIYLNNLSSLNIDIVKKIFFDYKVLLTYFLSNTTELLKPNDTRYGRLLYYTIGKQLDKLLMIDKNLEK